MLKEKKDRGNELFRKGDYKGAIKVYEEGIIEFNELESAGDEEKGICSILLCNQSTCFCKLNQWDDGERTARDSLKYNPNYMKAAYQIAYCLNAKSQNDLNLLKEAKLALLQALIRTKNLSKDPRTLSCVGLYRKLDKEHLDKHYFEKLMYQGVEVKYDSDNLTDAKWYQLFKKENNVIPHPFYSPTGSKGKGVFAKTSFARGDLVVMETPLACHIKVKKMDPSICFHCLNQKLQRSQFNDYSEDVFKEVEKLIYGSYYPKKATNCSNCDAFYCSEECKEEATYHKFLCDNGSGKREKLYNLAKNYNQTNPLLIARMFGIVLTENEHYFKECDREFSPNYMDFGCFEFFECIGQSSSHDEELFESIKDLILFNVEHLNLSSNFPNALLTIETYRKFYAMIQRNAQEVIPTSDFHTLLAFSNDNIKKHIENLFPCFKGKLHDINTLLQNSTFLFGLCNASGSSMLRIANCMNHSCEPNIMACNGHSEYKVQFMAIKPIAKGDELFRSYINEYLPFNERQKQLKNEYGFQCQCPKCQKRI